jgi:hypothetical protein
MAEFKTVHKLKDKFRRTSSTVINVGGDNPYDIAYRYIQKDLPGKLESFNKRMAGIVGTGANFLVEGEKLESEFHDALLDAVNLRGLHDLTLSSPNIDELLLQNIRVTEGNVTLGLSDLSVATRRNSSLSLNTDTVNPISTSSISGKYRLARLQIIPLTDSLYMSLAKNGGFYVREGTLLVPLVLEDTSDYISTLKKLNSRSYMRDAVKNLHNFNRFVNSMNEGMKNSGSSVNTLLNNVKVESSTPKSTITFGGMSSAPAAAATNYSQAAATPQGQAKVIVLNNGTGFSQGQSNAIPMGDGTGNTFRNLSGVPYYQMLTTLFGFTDDTKVPFPNLEHSSPEWITAFTAAKGSLPANDRSYYGGKRFDADIAIASIAYGQDPLDMVKENPQSRKELLEVVRMSYPNKIKFMLQLVNRFLVGHHLDAAGNLPDAYKTLVSNPNVYQEFLDGIANPKSLYSYSPQLRDFLVGA